MIVTREWLEEFIDLKDISNKVLYRVFNEIGLEVDSFNEIKIPQKVVVGEIISCSKHPDANKLNVCSINVGEKEPLQIVCGASNVVNAKYVAVAKVGAVLGDNFAIKEAKLRGVDSFGMVCSSTEIGLPKIEDGIMILDDSMGSLEVGKELKEYIKDTIIELELTANRGDCLSIYGVAKDLSVFFNKELKSFNKLNKKIIGTNSKVSLGYLSLKNNLEDNFLINLRLAIVDKRKESSLENFLTYAKHSTGVILRAYNDQKVELKENDFLEVVGEEQTLSKIGINQEVFANKEDILIEASYIDPEFLVEEVYRTKIETDELYYNSSRGSNPNIQDGLSYLFTLLNKKDTNTYNLTKPIIDIIECSKEMKNMETSTKEICNIIGMQIEDNKIYSILEKLGFKNFTPPLSRFDIKTSQDIAEEIMRIVGIDNIPLKNITLVEKPRLNETTSKYKFKRELKQRAVALGFYENISYVFTQRELLEKYNFSTLDKELELKNPIATELNTLRSTILINLLIASEKNISHSKKRVPLFEIGSIFNEKREEKEVVSIIFSGDKEIESVKNAGKPENLDFASFTQKLGGIIGEFSLNQCSYKNSLIHPYQSANIIVDKKVIGFISKLHPTVQDNFSLPISFIAEIELNPLLPKHINYSTISKFQGVYKDLSILIDEKLSYNIVKRAISNLNIDILKDFYPIDIYQDKDLGEKKSLTIRFFIQSLEKTLEENNIETIMIQILETLQKECNASLR